jgi:hypothetical protein
MRQVIADHGSWLLSILTITIMWAAGEKKLWTWRLGLAAQFLWLGWIACIGQPGYGLIPTSVALLYVYWNNDRKWRRDNG